MIRKSRSQSCPPILKAVYFMLLLLLIVSTLSSTCQQTGIIHGTVYDRITGETLTGATILTEKNTGTSTDINGYYQLELSSGKAIVKYNFIGYREFSHELVITDNDTILLDVFLEQSRELLDEIVISASRFEQKLSDITVSMEVLKPRLIRESNPISLDVILNQIPGIDVMDGQASIRGGSGYSYGAGSRILVLVDDLPILSADAMDVKWSFLPIENVSMVEVLKGASSVLYGSSALNGVIHFRTKYPGINPQTRINIYTGLYTKPSREEMVWWEHNPIFLGVDISHAQKTEKLDVVASINYFANQGYRENEFEQRTRMTLNLTRKSSKIPGLIMGLNSNLMYTDKSDFLLWLNSDSGAYVQNPEVVSTLFGTRLSLDPYISFTTGTGDHHSLKTRYLFFRNDFLEAEDKNNASKLFYVEYKYHRKIGEIFDLVSGITGSYSLINGQLYGDHYSNNAAIFSQLNSKIGDKFTWTAGLRWEIYRLDNESASSPVVFRAGMNYRAAKATFLRFSLGQGYRYPSVAEKFTGTQVGALNIFPNPYLNPETGWNAEIGIKQGFTISNIKGFLDISGFRTEYKDMIEFNFGVYAPDTVTILTFDHVGFKALNTGMARITGFEITLSAEGQSGSLQTHGQIGYTYLNPIDLTISPGNPDTLNLLKYRFKHSFKTNLEFSRKKIRLGTTIIFRSKTERIDEIFIDPLVGNMILPGFPEYWKDHQKAHWIVNARVGYKISRRGELTVHAKNLLNKEYIIRPGDIGPPRNFSLQLSWNF